MTVYNVSDIEGINSAVKTVRLSDEVTSHRHLNISMSSMKLAGLNTGKIRSLANINLTYDDLNTGESHELSSNNSNSSLCYYFTEAHTDDGSANVAPLSDQEPVDSINEIALPSSVLQTLSPRTLEFPRNRISNFEPRMAKNLKIHPSLKGSLSNAICHIGADLSYQVVINNDSDWLSNVTNQDASIEVEVLKIHKLKGTFDKTQITVKEYCADPSKYIVVVYLPKYLIKWNTAFHYVGILVNMPTLIIPSDIIETTSDRKALTGAKLLDALNRNEFNNLIDTAEAEEFKQNFPHLSKYWTGINRILRKGTKRNSIATLESISSNLSDPIGDVISDPITRVSKRPVYTQLMNRAQRFVELVDKENQTNQNINKTSDEIHLSYSKKAELEESLANTQALIISSNEHLIKLEAAYAELELAVQTEREKLKDNWTAFKTADMPPIKITKNIKIQSMGINGLYKFYSVNANGAVTDRYEHIMTLDSPENVAEFYARLAREEAQIFSMHLVTETPHHIYVDADSVERSKAQVVVGGPYYIKLEYDQHRLRGLISLRSPASIFGIKEIDDATIDAKCHPHCKELRIGRSVDSLYQFCNAQHTMCFGEDEQALIRAMRTCNIDMATDIIDNWCSSAYTKDRWGVDFAWFPTPEQLKL